MSTVKRTAAEIEAEIHRLEDELKKLKAEDPEIKTPKVKKEVPDCLYAWDIYDDEKKRGTWVSTSNDLVFETENKAVEAGYNLLCELDDQGDLEGDPDDYWVDAVEVSMDDVTVSVLEYSGLGHLID